MIPSNDPGYNPRVLERIRSYRRCDTPARHLEYQPSRECADLCVSESLNPAHYIRYTRCGLCAGIVTIHGDD